MLTLKYYSIFQLNLWTETAFEKVLLNQVNQVIKIKFRAYWIYNETKCVWKTQMPAILANFKNGQDQKDIYYDTCKKILQGKWFMWNVKALVLIVQMLLTR